jgi:murein L,D-transpeptidase YcbB/YkuD
MRLCAWLLAGIVVAGTTSHAQAPPLPAGLTVAIAALAQEGYAAQERSQLTRLYREGGALWFDPSGSATTQAREAVRVLSEAQRHGLVPAHYGMPHTAELMASISDRAQAAPETRTRAEVRLSAGMLRFWRDLHIGRIDPRRVGFRMSLPQHDDDFVLLLRHTVSAGRIAQTTADLTPPLVLYRLLLDALARYRALAASTPPFTMAPPAHSITAGMPITGAEALERHLIMLGDLARATGTATTGRYEPALAQAVARFQRRHGLADDGVLGRATAAALTVPLTARMHQIELSLERLRWLPELRTEGLVAVNIPMFRLWAWTRVTPSAIPDFSTNVIVGKALNTQTPALMAEMRRVVFHPYWNVPRSILTKELLPVIARDPAYLTRQDMDIVRGPSDASPVVPYSSEALAGLRSGALRLRQRPGPRNSLGRVKFEFPNDEHIYMHDTPSTQLFGRARRDFSHGCIRLEQPEAMADYVLRDQSGWTPERVAARMRETRTERVELSRSRQVVLYYLTAVVMPDTGQLHFADDVYRHDARLTRALGALR